MKINDLRKKAPKDLAKQADNLRESIAKAENEKFTTDDKNVRKQRNQRKDLARILTLLKEQPVSTETGESKGDK